MPERPTIVHGSADRVERQVPARAVKLHAEDRFIHIGTSVVVF
jgi:formyltetrahydrofolate hydrolase